MANPAFSILATVDARLCQGHDVPTMEEVLTAIETELGDF